MQSLSLILPPNVAREFCKETQHPNIWVTTDQRGLTAINCPDITALLWARDTPPSLSQIFNEPNTQNIYDLFYDLRYGKSLSQVPEIFDKHSSWAGHEVKDDILMIAGKLSEVAKQRFTGEYEIKLRAHGYLGKGCEGVPKIAHIDKDDVFGTLRAISTYSSEGDERQSTLYIPKLLAEDDYNRVIDEAIDFYDLNDKYGFEHMGASNVLFFDFHRYANKDECQKIVHIPPGFTQSLDPRFFTALTARPQWDDDSYEDLSCL